jgi:hypothetical protein
MNAPHAFPPAKISANRAIGNWLAELSRAPMQDEAVDEAMDADDELETLATMVAREIEDAYATGHRVGDVARAATARSTIPNPRLSSGNLTAIAYQLETHGSTGISPEAAARFLRHIAGQLDAFAVACSPEVARG